MTKQQQKQLERSFRENLKLELESRIVCSSEAYKQKNYAKLIDGLTLDQCFLLDSILEELH